MNTQAAPQMEMVGDEMVEAYCNAVHHYLGNLSQEQWAEDRKDNYTAVRHVARIGLQAALNARAGGGGWLPIKSAPKDGNPSLFDDEHGDTEMTTPTLLALADRWRDEANDAELCALEADSIGLDESAKSSDAHAKWLRHCANELRRTLASQAVGVKGE